MTDWSHVNVWEPIAKAVPDRPAFIQGDRVVSWGQFDAAADAIAADLIKAGLPQGAKVAMYLYNCPEYMIAYFAALKAGFAPINTNYRYVAEELHYLFDNADAEAIVFHAGFSATIENIRARLPKVKRWIAVGEPGFEPPTWAADYDAIIAAAPAVGPVRAPWGVSGDDQYLIYTGGTTGRPKGVVWRQHDWYGVYEFGADEARGLGPANTPDELAQRAIDGPRVASLISCPVMHATAQYGALLALMVGGACIFLPSRKFDAIELWNEVERLKATRIVIAGLAFSAPMVDALEAHPGRWDLSSVTGMVSSGAMWSLEHKRALLTEMPQASLKDSFGSSEAVGMGVSISTAQNPAKTARFPIGPLAAVFKENGERVKPGSGERGLAAVTGHLPLGYYKDEEKSAGTFVMFEGKRWAVPGDWAEIDAEGSLILLGRGSQCINTGGEKVFPEEVEEALKRHSAIRDAAVVGVPDPRFGERVCAVVELEPKAEAPALRELADHVRADLSDYKAPRELVIVETLGRAPNGKLDYKAIKECALARLGA